MSVRTSSLVFATVLSLLVSGSARAQVWAQGRVRVASPTPDSGSFGATVALLDFDGDGDLEIAVGDPDAQDTEGSHPLVYILVRTASGWEANWVYGQASKTGFGRQLAVGDFDEDGRDDLLVGVPEIDGGGGAVYLVRHSSATSTTVVPIVSGGSASGGSCGTSLAVGDFDDDENLDFAAGCPYASFDSFVGAGRIVVATGFGSGNFGVGYLSQDSADIAGGPETGDEFGRALAAGDFDGDGDDDLAVGVPGEDTDGGTDTGALHVLFGAGAGLSGAGSQLWHQGSTGVPGTSGDGDHFGAALAAGDFDFKFIPPECNCDDLVVGIPDDAEQVHGSALVLPGSLAGPTATGVVELSWPTANDESRFGAAFAVARLDSGLTDDLVVGTEGSDEPFTDIAGGVCSSFGSASGLVPGATCFLGSTSEFDAAGGGVSFGTALALGQLDGLAGRDLVIGNGDGREIFILRNALFADGFEIGFTNRWSFASDD
jgi:hypothetical protein